MIQSVINLLLINEKIYDISIFSLREKYVFSNYHKGAMWAGRAWSRGIME